MNKDIKCGTWMYFTVHSVYHRRRCSALKGIASSRVAASSNSWASNTDVRHNTHIKHWETHHHHSNALRSDKTSGRCLEPCCRQCEAAFLHRLMNWQKPPRILRQTAESINNAALASVSQPGGRNPSFIHFCFAPFLFIHHHFFTILFFSRKSSVFLITSGLFITNDNLHIALQMYQERRRKWGRPSHSVFLYWWKER